MVTGDQAQHAVRFEWGATGGAVVAAGADLAVVADVLTFSTAVTVAVERGTVVIPYPSAEPAALTVAAQHGAALAGSRGAGGLSLSPASLRDAPDLAARLVLPSPNGATVAESLRHVTTVAAACLRNAAAVARHAATHASVAVVAAGERWADGSLRPAVEDLWGAGLVLSLLEDDGADLSPEAAVAADAYRLVAGRESGHLRACASGDSLIAAGFAADVDIAAEVGVCDVVPVLEPAGFTPVT